jgi:hypothetical protein
LEISGRRSALASAQFIEIGGLDCKIAEGLEELHVFGQFQRSARCETLQDPALVCDFCQNQSSGDVKDKGGFESAAILVDPEQSVGIGGRQKCPEELAVPCEETDGDVVSEQSGEGFGGDLGAFPEDEAFEVMEWNIPDPGSRGAVFSGRPDFESLGFEVQAGSRDQDTGRGHGGGDSRTTGLGLTPWRTLGLAKFD